MISLRKAISRAFLAVSMAYDLVELYVYCLLVFVWLFAVFFGFSAPCGSSKRQFYDIQENYDIYEDKAMPKLNLQMVVPPVRAVVKGPNEVDNFPEPCAERLATAPTTHEVIHLEVPLVIEDASEPFCHSGFASNNGSDMSISSLSSIEIVDTPTPSPGGNRRGDRDASRDLNSNQLRPLLLSTQKVDPQNKRTPLLRVDAPAFVPASRSSSVPVRRASGSENVPLPPSAYWGPPPNSAVPVISVPYKRPRRRGGRAPVISEREIRERATRLGTKALQPVKI